MTKKFLGITAICLLTLSLLIFGWVKTSRPARRVLASAKASTTMGVGASPARRPDEPRSNEIPVPTPAAISNPIAPQTAHPAIDAFRVWSEQFTGAAPGNRTTLLTEVEALAVKREEELKELIKTDPKLALESSVPMRVRSQLPENIARHLEERVSGRGFYGVLIGDDFEKGTREVRREVILNGNNYQAFVYGRRVTQTTKANIPMHGIAIGSLLALHEDPVRPFEPGEPIPDGTGKELCPVSSKPAKEILATVGKPSYFKTAAASKNFISARTS